MAIYEFTQQFTYTNPGSTAAQYSLLQPNPGVYIIKGMDCYSTTGLVVGPLSTSVQIVNTNSSTPTFVNYMYSTPETAAANDIVGIFNPAEQVILTQPYLGTICSVTGGVGIFRLNVSYIYIPTSNANSAKFKNYVTSVTHTIGASFTGQSATVATIIKSILIVNNNGSDSDVVLYLNGTALHFVTVAAGGTYLIPIPIFLSNIQTLTVGSSSVNSIEIIYSYTLG